ncbi:MAG: sugar-binding transcriptional regulator [Chloroflexota bacterium]|nr:sugar-binding transcriptional regulator [Chloroflexota bacterium]
MNTQLTVQIARLYYEHDLTQQQIADKLNITRQKVSRLLIQGREDGIVNICINNPTPSEPQLETELLETFDLNKVILTGSNGLDQESLWHSIGIAAADYLHQTLKDSDHIGIGWGRTLFEVVSTLRNDKMIRINVIPMIGGAGDMAPSFQVNELARLLAAAFGGRYRPIYAPAFTQDIDEWKTIMATREVRQVVKLWPQLDKAIVGVGHVEFQKKSSMFFTDHITPTALDRLESEGGVGDICGNFFDIQGKPVADTPGIVGVNLEQLRQIPEVIAAAGGLEKVGALVGALQGSFIKTLITDVVTARAVLTTHKEEVVL